MSFSVNFCIQLTTLIGLSFDLFTFVYLLFVSFNSQERTQKLVKVVAKLRWQNLQKIYFFSFVWHTTQTEQKKNPQILIKNKLSTRRETYEIYINDLIEWIKMLEGLNESCLFIFIVCESFPL